MAQKEPSKNIDQKYPNFDVEVGQKIGPGARFLTLSSLTDSLRPPRLKTAYLCFLCSVLGNSKHAEPVYMFSRPVSQILLLSGTIRCRCDTFCDTRRWHQKLPYGLFTASSAQTAYLGFPSSVLANSKHEEFVYIFSRPYLKSCYSPGQYGAGVTPAVTQCDITKIALRPLYGLLCSKWRISAS